MAISTAPPEASPSRPATIPLSSALPKGQEWLAGGRVPSLDGLRAISICLVLFAHAVQTHGFPAPGLKRLSSYGAFGVQVFFAISGFLITLLLLREQSRTGRISLPAFYQRRALRIFPAYFLFAAVIAVLVWRGVVHLKVADWVGVFTYTINFVPNRSWETGHLWSLSIEEHFYLVWPLIVAWVAPRSAKRVLLGYLLAAPLLRLAVRFFWKEQLPMVSDWTFTALDSIAVGCLLALLASEPGACQRLLATRKQAMVLGVAALVILIGSLILGVRFYLYQIAFGCTLNAFCIAVLIWLAITHRESPVGRFLNWKGCVFVGTLSYSLYLWQQPFLNPHSAAWPCRWPINLLLAIGAALLSYFLVESPFLRLKKRVAH